MCWLFIAGKALVHNDRCISNKRPCNDDNLFTAGRSMALCHCPVKNTYKITMRTCLSVFVRGISFSTPSQWQLQCCGELSCDLCLRAHPSRCLLKSKVISLLALTMWGVKAEHLIAVMWSMKTVCVVTQTCVFDLEFSHVELHDATASCSFVLICTLYLFDLHCLCFGVSQVREALETKFWLGFLFL